MDILSRFADSEKIPIDFAKPFRVVRVHIKKSILDFKNYFSPDFQGLEGVTNTNIASRKIPAFHSPEYAYFRSVVLLSACHKKESSMDDIQKHKTLPRNYINDFYKNQPHSFFWSFPGTCGIQVSSLKFAATLPCIRRASAYGGQVSPLTQEPSSYGISNQKAA